LKSRGRDALVAIVPVNILAKSKARLAPSLNAAARRQLSTAMLTDVLTAVSKVRRVRRIIVVSADKSVRRLARVKGAHFLWEGKRRGLNKGIDTSGGHSLSYST
jgi:2-phospho-L-lactate guanylyltransferase (CobY/MobA/RfbA family)